MHPDVAGSPEVFRMWLFSFELVLDCSKFHATMPPSNRQISFFRFRKVLLTMHDWLCAILYGLNEK